MEFGREVVGKEPPREPRPEALRSPRELAIGRRIVVPEKVAHVGEEKNPEEWVSTAEKEDGGRVEDRVRV